MATSITFSTYEISDLLRILEREEVRLIHQLNKNKITKEYYDMSMKEIKTLQQRLVGKNYVDDYNLASKRYMAERMRKYNDDEE